MQTWIIFRVNGDYVAKTAQKHLYWKCSLAHVVGRVVMHDGYSEHDAVHAFLTYRWDREYQYLPAGMVHPTDAA